MRILVIGSGGREHALCWKIAQSKKCDKLYCAPGNGGISRVAEVVDFAADDIDGLARFARANRIDLTVVGPELPMISGIVDRFEHDRLKIFGPLKELAMLEGSKVFAKETMKKFGVPTADYRVLDNLDNAVNYARSKIPPIVIKADGLCAGKGVIVCKSADEAQAALETIFVEGVFGDAGKKVIVEDFIDGEEASIIIVTDGKTIIPLASSQDHKRSYDGDRGPNTGGMGAYSPAPIVTDEILGKVMRRIIEPVVRGLAGEGKTYKGALYAGVMIHKNEPYLLEFNARFGDPETQAILPRLKSDIVEMFEKAVLGDLASYAIEWDARPCVSVVLASGGYPGHYEKGMVISGIENAEEMENVVVFHAGTKPGSRSSDRLGMVLTNGGRVLNVTALGTDIRSAMDRCYAAVEKIKFDRMHYRKDIGKRALLRSL